MSERILLKLGGSVITDKNADCIINHNQLSRIASAVSRLNAGSLIIIHGAGSCGHPEAKRYRLDEGAVAGRTEGIYVTHRAVSRLNESVVEALHQMGIPAAGIHPFHAAVADRGRLLSFECPASGKNADA